MRRCGTYRSLRLGFEFLVLTAARSGEVRGARWDEIDRDGAVWTVPAERMKAGREHRVPLSPRALEVLDGARELADADGWVFPLPTGRALNTSALSKLMRELDIGAVPHGFRSSFRDRAALSATEPFWRTALRLDRVPASRAHTVKALSSGLAWLMKMASRPVSVMSPVSSRPRRSSVPGFADHRWPHGPLA